METKNKKVNTYKRKDSLVMDLGDNINPYKFESLFENTKSINHLEEKKSYLEKRIKSLKSAIKTSQKRLDRMERDYEEMLKLIEKKKDY